VRKRDCRFAQQFACRTSAPIRRIQRAAPLRHKCSSSLRFDVFHTASVGSAHRDRGAWAPHLSGNVQPALAAVGLQFARACDQGAQSRPNAVVRCPHCFGRSEQEAFDRVQGGALAGIGWRSHRCAWYEWDATICEQAAATDRNLPRPLYLSWHFMEHVMPYSWASRRDCLTPRRLASSLQTCAPRT
jgi:hypothetical protein